MICSGLFHTMTLKVSAPQSVEPSKAPTPPSGLAILMQRNSGRSSVTTKILGDAEQRAAYDHLLELARLEPESASKRTIAVRIHKLASGVIALAGERGILAIPQERPERRDGRSG